MFAVALLTGVVLFGPSGFTEALGLAALPPPVRVALGISFAGSACLLLANWSADIAVWGQKEWRQRQELKARHWRLHNLTPDEQEILRPYIADNTRTQYLSYTDGVVRGLEHERIIYRSAEVGHMESWAYNIQPWAWTYLNQHRELLAG